MSDNLAVTPGSGAQVATKDVSGVHHQYAAMEFFDAGTATPVTPQARLPVVTDELIYLLNQILEKMPRVDGADRLMVSHAESNPTVAIASAQTVATVTTVGAVTNIGGRDAAHTAFALANMGALHIYNNIQVTA